MSDLPDPILHLILTGLPFTEEVVRTSILSTRWRYLWTLIPSLDIDCTRRLNPSTPFKPNVFNEFVSRVLVDQTLDLESVRLCCANHYSMSTVGRWIDAAVMRKVKSLDLNFSPSDEDEAIELPLSLVTCESLEVLRLFLYKRPISLPTLTGFSALRVLELNSIELTDGDAVEQFLNSCPVLEDLSLIDCLLYQLNDLCISSPNLKTLRIENRKKDRVESSDDDDDEDGGVYFGDDGIDYGYYSENDGMYCYLYVTCPKLVYLEHAGHVDFGFRFTNLHSLKKALLHPEHVEHKEFSLGDSMSMLFAGVSHVESLSLNLLFIQGIFDAVRNSNRNRNRNRDLPASLPNLKTLEISTTIEDYTLDIVTMILKWCPSLESLHLIFHHEFFGAELCKFDEELTHHLKRVEFREFNGEKRKLDMVRFLLEHGNELEEMVFSWSDKAYYSEKSTEIMKEVLKVYNGSSSTAKLITLLKE